jgi:hypothetical protein
MRTTIVRSCFPLALFCLMGPVFPLAADDLSSSDDSQPPQPLHQWAFDTIADGKSPDTGSSNTLVDAKIIGGNLEDGKFGKAVSFPADGTVTVSVNGTSTQFPGNTKNHVEIPLDLNNLIDRGFTLTLWAQAADQPQGYGIFVTSGRHQGFELRAAHDLLSLSVNMEWNAVKSAPRLFTDGTGWTHIALVYTQDKASLYVDGQLIGAHATSNSHNFWPILFLGGYDANLARERVGAGEYPFKLGLVGKIDDFCFYDHILTDAQIGKLAKATQP